jgi:tRNA (mo5U34)-methyltransferase
MLYHVKDPLACLETVAKLARETLVVETVTALNGLETAAMQFFPDGSMGGDNSNYWAPNTLCLGNMLKSCGFNTIEIALSPVSPSLTPSARSAYERHIVHATR